MCPRDGARLGQSSPGAWGALPGARAATPAARAAAAAVPTTAGRRGHAGSGSRPSRQGTPADPAAVAAALLRSDPSLDAAAAPQEDEDEALLGRVLGSYRLLAVIGRGGMGRVYLAEHVKLGRRVALKLLKPEYAARRDSVARFFQEARAVNTIRHRNIVDITDFVELPDHTTFIIMELLSGANLGELVRREGPLAPHRALSVLIQVCDALEAAHRVGIVHRDLKPDNIFVLDTEGARDTVKLLDFGVAKLLVSATREEQLSLQTLEGSVVGTPAYMSPEQAAGLPVDHRSDIYALGAIMYELFTGRRVFEARSFGEFVLKHVSAVPIPPRDLKNVGPLPAGLEPIILSCLEKQPEHRYQTTAALRADLARVMAGEHTAALELPPGPHAGRIRLAWIVGAGLAGVLAAGAAVLLLLPDRARPAATSGRAGRPAAGAGGAAAARPAAADVEFSFRSDPPGAQVFAVGEVAPLGTTPLRRVRPGADRERDFIFRLTGYREQRMRAAGATAPEAFALLEPEAGARAGEPRRGRRPTDGERPGAPRLAPVEPLEAPAKAPPAKAPPAPGKKRIDKVDTVDPFAE
ncbi:MAG TPA: serine/threonine-protein kinase [Polyangia bacterium]